MTLTALEVVSLTSRIDRWEYAEYACTAFVAIACLGEYIADFTDWWSGNVCKCFGDLEHRKERIAKFSTLVLIAALAGELLCVVRTNQLSGELVGDLGDRSEEAFSKSEKALNDSGKATTESEKAKTTASSAVVLAGTAKKEADSFERDIKLARKQAAEAESHLSEAVSMAIAEEAELRKLEAQVAPRTLNADQMRSVRDHLQIFRGHPAVRVTSYALDGEGAAVATEIISIISSATGVMPLDERASFSVTGGFESGVQIRGPASEDRFMSALATEFTSTVKLAPVVINGATFRPGVIRSGNTVTGGRTSSGGGGGIVMPPIPTAGPVVIHVGIRPLPVLTFQ